MPIIKTENGYIYKTIKKRTNSKAKFLFALFLCSVILTVGVFYLFTRVDFAGVFNLNKYQVFQQKTYYAVYVNSGDDFATVAENVDDIKLKGGAGFVIELNKKYYLIANVYSNKSDAENVVQNITDFNAQVLQLKLNKLVLSSSFNSMQISALKESLNGVNTAFDSLYNISLSLDRGEIFDAEAKQKLLSFKETCQQNKEMLNQAFQNNFETIVTRAKIFTSELLTSIMLLQTSQNLSSDIKYTIVSTISSFLQLQSSITK